MASLAARWTSGSKGPQLVSGIGISRSMLNVAGSSCVSILSHRAIPQVAVSPTTRLDVPGRSTAAVAPVAMSTRARPGKTFVVAHSTPGPTAKPAAGIGILMTVPAAELPRSGRSRSNVVMSRGGIVAGRGFAGLALDPADNGPQTTSAATMAVATHCAEALTASRDMSEGYAAARM